MNFNYPVFIQPGFTKTANTTLEGGLYTKHSEIISTGLILGFDILSGKVGLNEINSIKKANSNFLNVVNCLYFQTGLGTNIPLSKTGLEVK